MKTIRQETRAVADPISENICEAIRLVTALTTRNEVLRPTLHQLHQAFSSSDAKRVKHLMSALPCLYIAGLGYTAGPAQRAYELVSSAVDLAGKSDSVAAIAQSVEECLLNLRRFVAEENEEILGPLIKDSSIEWKGLRSNDFSGQRKVLDRIIFQWQAFADGHSSIPGVLALLRIARHTAAKLAGTQADEVMTGEGIVFFD